MIYLDPMTQFSFWLLRFVAEVIIIPLIAFDPMLFFIGVGGLTALLLVYVCVK